MYHIMSCSQQSVKFDLGVGIKYEQHKGRAEPACNLLFWGTNPKVKV